MTPGGTSEALCSGEKRWGALPPNICYPLEGNGSHPSHRGGGYSEEDVSFTLNATEHHGVAYGLDRASYNQGANAKYDFSVEKELSATLVAKGPNAVCHDARGNGINRAGTADCNGYRVCYPEIARSLCARADSSPCVDRGQNVVCVGNGQLNQTDLSDKAGTLNCMHDQQAAITNGKPPRKYIVRRLTPTECARLQGFPDLWCEGLGGSDSAIYKAYGNGLALPCAEDVMRRIAKELRKDEKE